MGKKINFLVVFFILLILAGGNIYIYFSKNRISISGFSILDFKNKFKFNFSTIFFIVQWVLILAVILIFYIKFLKKKKKEKASKGVKIEIKKNLKEGETDLDVFYDLLKERKHLKISTIAKTFKISNEKALGWGKILENQQLVSIEYPAFAEPEVVAK